MTDITIFPDRLTAMTEADLAALPAEQLREIHFNLAQLVEWVKKAQAKTHNAMKRRYAEQERTARSEAGKDFGTVHFQDGPVRVTVDDAVGVRVEHLEVDFDGVDVEGHVLFRFPAHQLARLLRGLGGAHHVDLGILLQHLQHQLQQVLELSSQCQHLVKVFPKEL